jgi:hypothetical protein
VTTGRRHSSGASPCTHGPASRKPAAWAKVGRKFDRWLDLMLMQKMSPGPKPLICREFPANKETYQLSKATAKDNIPCTWPPLSEGWGAVTGIARFGRARNA